MLMIRPLVLCDITKVVNLGRSMHEESPVFKHSSFDEKTVADLLALSLKTPENVCVLVNDINGEITGGIIAFAYKNWFGPERVASDLALFVTPDKRGGVIAARLVKQYEQWAKSVGCSEVTIGVSTGVNTERTALLFQRLGYKDPAHSFRKRL